MLKWRYCNIVCSVALLATACTQSPAPVEYKGNQFYGREFDAVDSVHHETYPADSPRYKEGYTQPVDQAPVPSVGVSDLPPPTNTPAANSPANSNPFVHSQPSAPVAPQVVASAESTPLKEHIAAGKEHFFWPVNGGKVVSHFGPKPDGKSNDGINISLADGEPIWASADGMVVYAGNELQGYGNMVILRHDDGWMTAYAHARSITVKKNDYVKQGELIAYVGQTGGVKTPQVHFALRHGKTPVDPEQYLPHTSAAQ